MGRSRFAYFATREAPNGDNHPAESAKQLRARTQVLGEQAYVGRGGFAIVEDTMNVSKCREISILAATRPVCFSG